MITYSLSDAPPFITNIGETIEVAINIFHDIIIEDERMRSEFYRALSVLSVARQACELVVPAIEAGPDYK